MLCSEFGTRLDGINSDYRWVRFGRIAIWQGWMNVVPSIWIIREYGTFCSIINNYSVRVRKLIQESTWLEPLIFKDLSYMPIILKQTSKQTYTAIHQAPISRKIDVLSGSGNPPPEDPPLTIGMTWFVKSLIKYGISPSTMKRNETKSGWRGECERGSCGKCGTYMS